ncbi:hypothetical protein K9L16_03865 [Candidatus Pacearchaeota archaeon]|nr:hypothetical protein [Candidatus Pacearchaeota archaeon]
MGVLMSEEIFKISRDVEKARSLIEMAEERLKDINILPRKSTYRYVEEYYEIIKELLTAIMYLDGLKTLSHVVLVDYLKKLKILNQTQFRLVHNLRKFRNDIIYYGKKISGDFLLNNETEIKKIIRLLLKFSKDKLKEVENE